MGLGFHRRATKTICLPLAGMIRTSNLKYVAAKCVTIQIVAQLSPAACCAARAQMASGPCGRTPAIIAMGRLGVLLAKQISMYLKSQELRQCLRLPTHLVFHTLTASAERSGLICSHENAQYLRQRNLLLHLSHSTGIAVVKNLLWEIPPYNL